MTETPQPPPLRDVGEALCESLNLQTKLAQEVVPLILSQILLLDRKQQDYGRQNLDDFGELGLLVRLNDKVCRLKNLYAQADPEGPIHESLEDSWRDAVNYALLGLLFAEEDTGRKAGSLGAEVPRWIFCGAGRNRSAQNTRPSLLDEIS